MDKQLKVVQFIPAVPIEQRCSVCGNLRAKAEFLCDMPIGITANTIDFKKRTLTCDKKLCRKCTTQVNGFDFCPDCIKKIKLTTKGANNGS